LLGFLEKISLFSRKIHFSVFSVHHSLPEPFSISWFLKDSLVLVYLNYINYVELIISLSGRQVRLLTTGMLNKKYLEGVCDKISDALLDEQKYQELKRSGELEDSLQLSPSETMRLKMVMEDYEDLKKMKDQIKTEKNKKE